MGAPNCRGPLVVDLTLPSESYATEVGEEVGGQLQLFLPELGVASKYVTRSDPKFLILSYSFSISCLYRIAKYFTLYFL